MFLDDESGERSVCVLLAGEESEITFLDAPPDHVVVSSNEYKIQCNNDSSSPYRVSLSMTIQSTYLHLNIAYISFINT